MDPLENSSRWSRWEASGPESAISNVFGVLDANLPKNWKRLTGDDLLPYASFVKPGSGWYALDSTPSYIGVVLSIERPRESELRGGWVRFARPPSPTGTPSAAATWDQVGRFLDEEIVPAVRVVGASIRVPTPEDAFLSSLPLVRVSQISGRSGSGPGHEFYPGEPMLKRDRELKSLAEDRVNPRG